MTHHVLRELPLFAGLSEADIDLLEEASTTLQLPVGEVLMSEGSPSGSLYVILEGEFEVLKRAGSQDVLLAVRGAGEVMGEMSLLDQTPRSATVRALIPSQVLEIGQEAFRRLLAASPSAALSILRTVTSRLRNTEGMLRQSEKMAALGTLAAGLAHELNNPAAALARSADQLQEALDTWRGPSAAQPTTEDSASLESILASVTGHAHDGPRQDPLEISDREERLTEALIQLGIEEPWALSGEFAAAGIEPGGLQEAMRRLAATDHQPGLRWLANGLAVRRLVQEIGLSAARISEIVRAVKAYAYLDQAPLQQVDVHAGLEDTLVILRQKLKPGIQVHREYDQALPAIEAYGSELNQVWTNLIDNAAQAMKGEGDLTLATARVGDEIEVRVCDSGPGIPPEIQGRIFEPFYTTKAPGEGTGLGLHLVYNIVVLHHRGKVNVRSVPGQTCFTVSLPIRPRGENER
jgi:signal transduction histidine kinase